jgi:hypothetical protein
MSASDWLLPYDIFMVNGRSTQVAAYRSTQVAWDMGVKLVPVSNPIGRH